MTEVRSIPGNDPADLLLDLWAAIDRNSQQNENILDKIGLIFKILEGQKKHKLEEK